MYKFNLHAIAPFVSFAISIAVGIFVIAKNRRSKLHVTLGVFCFFASLWQFGTGMMFMAKKDALAIFWDRIVYIGVNFMWMVHFHFSVLFSKSKDKKLWLIAAYVIAIFYSIFIFTDYLIHDLYRYSWGCHTIAGPLHHSFVLFSTGFYFKSLYLIYRSYKRTENVREKAQYKYYFIGFLIYVSASLAYLPAYKISIYPFAYWFETIYCAILVYIIIKHRMLDIETVIHKTVLWLTTSTISLLPAALIFLLFHGELVDMQRASFSIAMGALVASSLILHSIVQPRIDSIFERRKYNYRTILRAFMDSVVTLHDTEQLSQITIQTLKKALHPQNIHCVWLQNRRDIVHIVDESGNRKSLELTDTLVQHVVRSKEILDRDFSISDPEHAPFKESLQELFDWAQAYLLVFIVHEDKAQGIVALGKKTNLQAYSAVDKQFLRELSVGISFAIVNAQMFETQQELLKKEKEARLVQEELVEVKDSMNKELEIKVEERTSELKNAMDRLASTNSALEVARDALWGEMVLAKKIQTILLPKQPTIDGYEVAVYTEPADEVGGDYYDVINAKDADWVVIGDVSGHGVSSGLIMMMAQTAIRTALEQNSSISPSTLLDIVNESLSKNIEQMSEDKYMTMTALSIGANGSFSFSGLHQDIIVYREKSQNVEFIDSQGMWLGIHRPLKPLLTQQQIRLESGDAILLYTDGITEARKKICESSEPSTTIEMFGCENLRKLFAGLAGSTVEQAKDKILETLSGYVCLDDATFLIIKRT